MSHICLPAKHACFFVICEPLRVLSRSEHPEVIVGQAQKRSKPRMQPPTQHNWKTGQCSKQKRHPSTRRCANQRPSPSLLLRRSLAWLMALRLKVTRQHAAHVISASALSAGSISDNPHHGQRPHRRIWCKPPFRKYRLSSVHIDEHFLPIRLLCASVCVLAGICS